MKLIKFQLGGNIKNLPLTDVLKFQLNQVNPLTGKKPEIRGWEINNGEFNVVTAESGTKLESKEATPFMNFFKFLIPGFKLAYDQKLALRNYDAKMKSQYRVRVPLQETPQSIYKPKVLLAKKPLTAAPVALNKPITKHLLGTTKGGLPTAQKVEDRYKGGRRVTNSSKYFGDSISVRGVESLAPWYKHPAQIVEYIRHSKVSPMFNDTTYAERPSFFRPLKSITRAAGNDYYFGKKQRYMLPIFGGFLNNNYEKSSSQEAAEYDTLKRRFNTAWRITK